MYMFLGWAPENTLISILYIAVVVYNALRLL